MITPNYISQIKNTLDKTNLSNPTSKNNSDTIELLTVLKSIDNKLDYLVKHQQKAEADKINSAYKGGHGY